jgi:hypothetical protein
MDKSTLILYRQIADRYCKMAWDHKIQEEQGDIYLKTNNNIRTTKCLLTALSTCGIITVFFIAKSFWWQIITTFFSAITTFLSWRYRDGELTERANENKNFAAYAHNMRNEYESLLSDIKSDQLTDKQIVERRKLLEDEEHHLFSKTITPHTTSKAVESARKALIEKQESTTTDEERNKILPDYLRIKEESFAHN